MNLRLIIPKTPRVKSNWINEENLLRNMNVIPRLAEEIEIAREGQLHYGRKGSLKMIENTRQNTLQIPKETSSRMVKELLLRDLRKILRLVVQN
jgi:hypothetical protein